MRAPLLVTLPLALLLAAAPAVSRDLDQDEALRLRREGLIMPLEALLQRALEHHPGPACWKRNWKMKTAATSTKSNCSPPRALPASWNSMLATVA